VENPSRARYVASDLLGCSSERERNYGAIEVKKMHCAAVLALAIFLISMPANAAPACVPNPSAGPGQPCVEFGVTEQVSKPTSNRPAAGNWIETGASLGCTRNLTAPTGSCTVGATTTSFASPGTAPGLCPPGQTFGQLYHWTCK
jgi:hypothetical protein